MSDKSENEKEQIQKEIDDFLEHREQIKKIVGSIGGKPKLNIKIMNIFFFTLLIITFLVPLFVEAIPHMYAVDFGILLISIKIIYSLTQQAKVNHYQFWILATLEWRLHDISSELNELKENFNEGENKSE